MPGTLITAVVFGLGLYGGVSLGWIPQMSIVECLLFGSLLSATDPVATLSVFQKVRPMVASAGEGACVSCVRPTDDLCCVDEGVGALQ